MNLPNCEQCQSQFDEENHCPRFFKLCGHTFCQNCIQALIDRAKAEMKTQIKCYNCKGLYTPDELEIASFPRNHGILDSIQLWQEEVMCDHVGKVPVDMICLDPHCINTHKFCGICYYTVHSKCRKRFVIREKEWSEKVEMAIFESESDEFYKTATALVQKSKAPTRIKEILLVLINRLNDYIKTKTSKPILPKFDIFFDLRQNYIVDLEHPSGKVVIQSKHNHLLNEFRSSFVENLERSQKEQITDFDILASMKALAVYDNNSSDLRKFVDFLVKCSKLLKSVNFKFNRKILSAEDLIGESLAELKRAIEETKLREKMSDRIKAFKAINTKFMADLDFMNESLNQATEAKESIVKPKITLLKNAVYRFEGAIMLRRSEINAILASLDEDSFPQAQMLLDEPFCWFLDWKDYTAAKFMISEISLESPEAMQMLDGVLQDYPSLRLNKESKRLLKRVLNGDVESSKMEKIIADFGFYEGSKDLGYIGVATVFESINPVFGQRFQNEFDPVMQFPLEPLIDYFTAVGAIGVEGKEPLPAFKPFAKRKVYAICAEDFLSIETAHHSSESKLKGAIQELQFRQLRQSEIAKDKELSLDKLLELCEFTRLADKAFGGSLVDESKQNSNEEEEEEEGEEGEQNELPEEEPDIIMD